VKPEESCPIPYQFGLVKKNKKFKRAQDKFPGMGERLLMRLAPICKRSHTVEGMKKIKSAVAALPP
jgi:hypothetical protein